jgi:hypothetical protein
MRFDTVCGDKQALADLGDIFGTVQPTHKIAKLRITAHMSDRSPLSPGDALDAGCTMIDAAITKLHQRNSMSFDLHFFFPQRPSRILVSKQKRALRGIGDMDTPEFSQMVLTKLPLTSMLPGVTVAITRQKHQTPKGPFGSFLYRIRELVRER